MADDCSQPGSGNDFTEDGDVSKEDFERVFSWDAWNLESEDSLNYWNNKYDRGVCSEDPCTPSTTGTTGTTGTSGSPDPEPQPYYCPRIELLAMKRCSIVKMFILGGKDSL